MLRFHALATAVICLFACADGSVEPTVRSSRAAILRGHPVKEGERWGTVALIVSLGRDEWLCTGTLIAPTLVVTAAHCVKDEFTGGLADTVLVVAGADDVQEASDDQLYEVARFVPHPRSLNGQHSGDPAGVGADYDIAIVQTAEPVQQVKPVPVLALERVDEVLSANAALLIAGYGTRVIDDQGISDLDGVHYAGTQHFVRRSDHEFLAGNSEDADTCPGDSGGPAYVVLNDEAWLVGATSRGRDDFPNVDCGEGGIYTLVPAFRAWIDETASGSSGDGDMTGDGDGDTGDDAGAGGDGDGDQVGDGDGDAPADGGSTPQADEGGRRRGKDSGCTVAPASGHGLTLTPWCALLALLLVYRRAKPGHTMSK